jgi:hypothetical protein
MARFPLETLAELGLGNLDCHDPVQASIERFVNLAHAACADRRENLVGSQTRSGG